MQPILLSLNIVSYYPDYPKLFIDRIAYYLTTDFKEQIINILYKLFGVYRNTISIDIQINIIKPLLIMIAPFATINSGIIDLISQLLIILYINCDDRIKELNILFNGISVDKSVLTSIINKCLFDSGSYNINNTTLDLIIKMLSEKESSTNIDHILDNFLIYAYAFIYKYLLEKIINKEKIN